MAQNEFLQHVEARNLLDTAEIPRFEERLSASIVLKKNVWIGSNATILSGVTIGESVVVTAGDQKCSRARDRGRRSCPGDPDDLNRSEVAVRHVGSGTGSGRDAEIMRRRDVRGDGSVLRNSVRNHSTNS